MHHLGEKLIAVVYEPYWEIETGVFCTLKPFCNLHGEQVDVTEFYNRGRIWWKLTPEDQRNADVGRILTIDIQFAPSFDEGNPNSDRYQVSYGSAMPADQDVVEIVELDGSTSTDYLLHKRYIVSERPFSKIIFCKIGGEVIGPFTCDCRKSPELRRSYNIHIQPGLGIHEVRRFNHSEFKRIVTPFERTIDIATQPREQHIVPIKYNLFLQKELNTLFSRQIGAYVDTRTDAEIISEVVKDIRWSRKDRQVVKRLVDDMNDKANRKSVKKNREKILEITKRTKDNQDVLRELTDELLEEERMQGALKAAVQRRVESYIRERRNEIETEIESEKRALSELKNRSKKEHEKLEQELAERKKQFEAEMREREGELEKEREAIETLIERLNDRQQEIVDQILTTGPIFRRLGVADGHPNPVQAPKPAQTSSPPPRQTTTLRDGGNGGKPRPPREVERWFAPLKGVPENASEGDFLERWLRFTAASGYSFTHDDLVNFHVCLKSEDLNILAGPSGIGKSSLPRLYAKALHGFAQGLPRFLMASVKPGWLDSQELLGHFNALESRFQPSGNGMFEFLINAAMEQGRNGESGVFICCLDEMNLSYIEHYFADFLSLLQKPIRERELHLFSRKDCSLDDPYCDYGTIVVPHSMRFCGTVNVDETTKFFSPKVIDRVHFIEISPPTLSDIRSWEKSDTTAMDNEHPISYAIYRSWDKNPQLVQDFVLRVLDEFERQTEILTISPRTYISICTYIANARGLLDSDAKAMDFAIFQKVLPKLRGHSNQFRENLHRFGELCQRMGYHKSAERLSKIADARFMDFFNYALD